MKNIVILGAGFGGLRCALDLARKMPSGWQVVLVDRNPYHVYYPRLYELIMPRNGHGCTIDVEDILKRTRVEFVQGGVQGVDCKNQVVKVEKPPLNFPLGKGEKEGVQIRFDYLVLALGAGTDYFGIPGLQEHACTLKSLKDAEVIRTVVHEFLQKKQERLDVIIGGAGATGVEVAAELAYLFRRVPQERWSVTLVEALDSVLWMFPKAVGDYAYKRLQGLGVRVLLDTCIKAVVMGANNESVANLRISNSQIRKFGPHSQFAPVEVTLAPRPLKPGESEAALACDFLPEHEKRIHADLLLWAGGIRANPLLTQCGLTVDRKGRVEVDEHLQVRGMEGVFALGDNATLINPATKQPVPATAQAALEQGKLVAQNVMRAIKGQPPQAYRFHDFFAIVPLADQDGVALVGAHVIRGFPAWLLRRVADYRYFGSVLSWWKALKKCIL